MRKKLLGALLVCFMIIGLLQRGEFYAQSDKEVWDGPYTLDADGTLTIGGTGALDLGNYSVPWEKDDVKKIVITEGVTSIGSSAFKNYGNLTSVTIPESVTSIGYGAFSGCSSLANVTIPESVTSLGGDVFEDTAILNDMESEDGLYYSGHWLLKADESVNGAVEIKTGTKGIANGAFAGCEELTSVTIPEGVTSIGDGAFTGCEKLASLTIPEGVTSIGDGTFTMCYNLASVTIPASVTSIGRAFFGCESLKSVVIPEGVTSIADGTFEYCYSLASVTIPESVTSIGACAFYGCKFTSIAIPASVTSIGDGAFSWCNRLTSVTIPEGVTSIEDETFYYCASLTSVTIPESVTSIGEYAFSDCHSLTSVTIPESVTSIGEDAFSGCRSLTSVTIPKRVTDIGEYAFGYVWNDEKGDNVIMDGFSIKCYAGTAGEAYAKENGITYELLEKKQEETTGGTTTGGQTTPDTNKDTSDKIAAADKGSTVKVETTKTDKISKDVIAAAKEKGIKLEIKSAADASGVSVLWKFDGIDKAIEFNPQVTVNAEVAAITEVLGGKDGAATIPASTKVTQISFAHDGDLPGEAEVEIPLSTEKFAEGSMAYLYYFDPAKKLFEKIDSAKCTGGKAVFKMKHCSDYIVTSEELPSELTVKAEAAGTTKTGDVNRGIYVTFMLFGMLAVGAAAAKKRSEKF